MLLWKLWTCAPTAKKHGKQKNTLVYTHLVDFTDEEFVAKAAWTLEEASRLVESGFEYVCDIENAKLFRKRK